MRASLSASPSSEEVISSGVLRSLRGDLAVAIAIGGLASSVCAEVSVLSGNGCFARAVQTGTIVASTATAAIISDKYLTKTLYAY